MHDTDSKDYDMVKQAILSRYNVNEEAYRRRVQSVTRDKNSGVGREVTEEVHNEVVDEIVKEQFIDTLSEDVKVWVKERKSIS